MRLINFQVIFRVLSSILFIGAVLIVVCIPVAIIYKEPFLPFLYPAIICALLATILHFLSHGSGISRVSTRDGYVAVTLSWLVLSAAGALPYIFSGTAPSFFDSFFESASGLTTTGASVFRDVESLPYSILFWRSLTHWIGGLGIILMVILILPSLKIAGFQLITLESSLKEKIHPRARSIVNRLLFIYLSITAAEIICLTAGDMNLFDSVCHTFGTVATGGFSVKNASIGFYSAYSQYVITIFMFLAGVSYVVYYHLFKLNFRKVKQNEELWFYIATVLIAGGLITGILIARTNMPAEQAFRHSFFQAISIITTTGYASTDYLQWPAIGTLVIFLLLFAGASTGSSTGSIKMARHLLMIKNIKNIFIRIVHPDAVYQIKLSNKVVAENTNISIIGFVVLFLFIFLAGTVLLVMSGSDPVTSASAVAASLGNVGPGLGSVGPMSNYAHFNGLIKLVLSFLMILGRLEIFTILVLFTRSFWKA